MTSESSVEKPVLLTETGDSAVERASPSKSPTHMENTPHVEATPLYEDPYDKAVKYMEQHHVLHIFREITEHMVHSRPDDPLRFMLSEVQNMLNDREKKVADILKASAKKD